MKIKLSVILPEVFCICKKIVAFNLILCYHCINRLKGVLNLKIIHLSDLHIGFSWFNRSMIKDQIYILKQISEIIEENNPDAIVIAGDIYDKSIPSADAIKVFDEFISELSLKVPDTEIMIISGNHDNSQRLNIFRQILSGHKIHMIGNPPQYPTDHIEKVILHDHYGNVNFYLLPFIKPSMVRLILNDDNISYNKAIHKIIEREDIDTNERNIIVSHQFYASCGKSIEDIERMDSERITVGNIDVVYSDILNKFDYSALGHIHKPSTVGKDNIRYCGTPLAYSVSETGQQKSITMIELAEKGNVKISAIPLKPLHEVRVVKGDSDYILSQGCDDYVSIIITDSQNKNDISARISECFPNLLEIRFSDLNYAHNDISIKPEVTTSKNIFDLCECFLNDLNDIEREILQDVINTVEDF